MKTIYKRIILISVILMLLFSINAKVFAWSEIIKDGQDFISTGQQDSSASQARINQENMKSGLQGLSGYLYNILLVAGVVIAVIVATVLGIQFMIGGAEGQAKVKEMLVPFVVGCIIVFGGFGIWKIAVNIGSKIEDASSGTSQVQSTSNDHTQYNYGRQAAETWAKGKTANDAYNYYMQIKDETGDYYAGFKNYLYVRFNLGDLYF